MPDLTSESPITLKAATKLPILCRDGRRLHLATLYRWSERGVRGVKLATIQVGATRCTTREAVLRFIDELSHPGRAPAVRSPQLRERQITQASRELEAEGW